MRLPKFPPLSKITSDKPPLKKPGFSPPLEVSNCRADWLRSQDRTNYVMQGLQWGKEGWSDYTNVWDHTHSQDTLPPPLSPLGQEVVSRLMDTRAKLILGSKVLCASSKNLHSLPFLPFSPLWWKFQNKTVTEPLPKDFVHPCHLRF